MHRAEAKLIFLYLATVIFMIALDLTWLGVIAKDFYAKHMGSLLEFNLLPGVLFYLMYAGAVVYFANRQSLKNAQKVDWRSVALDSALLGFTAYATYDLTNLATIRNWSLQMSLVDMAWGTFATTLAGTLGALAVNKVY